MANQQQRNSDGHAATKPTRLLCDVRLDDLAREIKNQHNAASDLKKRGIEHARKAGQLLIDAKRQLKHGQWARWVSEHLRDVSVRTLQNYMQLAKLTEADAQRVADLSYRAALSVLAKSKADERATTDRAACISRRCPAESEGYRLLTGDFATAEIEPRSIDAIITDPPYPQEYLPLYERLAQQAVRWLKPGGSLVCMCGHMYLPDIYAAFSRHLTYYWTLAYLLPGPSAHMWSRKAVPQWKPLLWFVNGDYDGRRVHDVVTGGGRDKRFHKWGQDEAGFGQLVERLTTPGDLIADPFCGAGTTGVAALRLQRRFLGVDVDNESVAITASRLSDVIGQRDAA